MRNRVPSRDTLEQHFRRPGSIGGLGIDVPVAATIRGEHDSAAVVVPQRQNVAALACRQTASGAALQVVNPQVDEMPDDGPRAVR